MINYDVGQVIYTILEEKQIIIPVQIVEQVVIKNLNGEEIKYKVILPNKKQQKVDISRLDKIFSSIDEAKSYLIDNANNAIDKMVRDAISLKEDYFKVFPDDNSVDESIECNNKGDNNIILQKDDNKIKVDLGNGMTANLNVESLEQIDSNLHLKDQKKNS